MTPSPRWSTWVTNQSTRAGLSTRRRRSRLVLEGGDADAQQPHRAPGGEQAEGRQGALLDGSGVPGRDRGSERMRTGAGQERRVPHFHHYADYRPLLTGHVGSDEPGQSRDLTAHLLPVLQVVLEGGLPAPGPGNVRRVVHRGGIQAAGDLHQPGPGRRAELRGEGAGVGGRELPDFGNSGAITIVRKPNAASPLPDGAMRQP